MFYLLRLKTHESKILHRYVEPSQKNLCLGFQRSSDWFINDLFTQETKNWSHMSLVLQTNLRNWFFVTNSNFLISIALQSNVVDLWYFKLWIVLNLGLKYQRFAGCKDIGIRTFEFGTKTKFLFQLYLFLSKSVICASFVHL